MSTQAYYKERLGFDPQEEVNGNGFYEGHQPKRHRGDRRHASESHDQVYEENLTKFKDERDAIQKKTFTKWVNKHLKKVNRHVNDLFEDLRDGLNLISLLEVLSGEHLPRERGRMRFHMLQNVQMALDFLRYKKIKLVNIRAEDIVDGNPKLTLGLIWTIILHFQISDIVVGQEANVTAREALLSWARRSTAKYPGVRVTDFTSSWRDGLAFNALIHRNRPDLIDWRNIRSRQVRERLETAFHVVEKEYGVTRLLDPEDVDTHEIDEKSLITYISSLYETFPEPAAVHPLFDAESQRRAAAYTEQAASHRAWLHENIALLQDRAFPSTLIEMKKLLSESTRFRSEEVPIRQREKQKLFHQYRELEKYFESVGECDIEPTLRPEALEQAWSRLLMAQQERERDLADEIRRLERLQRRAEKLHRDIKQTEAGLDSVERHIESEIRRVERGVHPAEAKMAAEQIEQELRTMENTIHEMFQDAQALKEGRYPQASDLQRRVQQIHDRWLNARQAFTGRLLPRLSSVRLPVQQTTVRRETRTVLETRVHDADPLFQQLQDATKWCKDRLKKLHEAEYGSDLPGVQHELDKHQREHKTIDQFHSKVEQCVHNRANFSGEELTLYNQHLNQLQKLYAELLSTSTKRMSDLDALQEFLQSATAELNWLNEKEQVELARDWADPHINLPAVQHYYEQLMSSLEKRELQFSNVIDRGEALIAQHHPATKTIEAHLQVMQSQWAWVLQLTLCLETHLKHTTHYHNFFEEVKEAEKWIQKREEALNSTFSQSEFTLDQGERLLKGMQELREELNSHGSVVSRLVEEAQSVRPVKQRRAPITRPLRAETVCAYKHANIAIEKGSAVTVVDNSGRSRWLVRLGGAGTEVQLPGAVVALPPPCALAAEAAQRLRNAYDRVIQLWQRKQLRMRQNMIFATIKVVKGWDFPQFVAMGAEQRQAIRRALNEDAEKLLGEGDPADPQLRRLRREIDDVNRLFDEFERRARAEEESKNAARIFTEQSSSLLERLEVLERQLHERIASHIPRDLDSLEHLVLQHKDWESSVLALTSHVEEVQATFRGIALKTPAMKKNLDKVMGKWNDMQSKSQLFVERLKYVEIVVNSMEENHQSITEFEIKLAQFNDLPNDIELLKDMHEDLLRMQVAVSKQQVQVEQMNDDAENCRRLVESSRAALPHTSLPRSGKHIDLERLDKEVAQLNTRWNNVCQQLAERLRSCEAAYQLLRNYNAGLEKEAEWIDDSFGKLQAQPPIEVRPKEQFEPTRNLLTSVVERTPKIEKVNVDGGRFIREAKIHSSRCQRYAEWLCDEVHPSLDMKQIKRQAELDQAERHRNRNKPVPEQSGAENVARELDDLNAKHQRLLDMLYERLRRIAAANPGDIVTLRLVEAMAPRSARSFRQEFNMQDLASSTEHTYTTTYTSEQYVRTSHSTELDGHAPVSNGKLVSPNYTTKTIIEDDRPDIRNLKRVHKMYEGPNIIESRGIVHPETKEILTVGQAINMRILDVRTGRLLSSPETRQTMTIEQAAKQGLIDPKLAARLTGPCGVTEDGNEVTLLEAIQSELYDAEQGLADPAEKRIKQAVEEKYRLCDETLSKLLEWIAVVEERLANQEAVKEDLDELRNQINILKLIKDDLESHQRQVSACADQAKQLLVSGGDVLAPHEVAALERGVRQLKQRCDKCSDKCDKMLRRLAAARDELGKFNNELNTFNTWMEGAYRTLEEKESALSKLKNLPGQSEDVREFVSDVIAHQADLRFITMAAQKFVDESKEFLTILNDYRTSLPSRLSHIHPSGDSALREAAALARRRHAELAARAQRLQDRLRGAADVTKQYHDALDRAQRWMKEVEPQARSVLSEPVGGEPRAVETQLARAKALHSEILAQGRLVDNAKDACDQLVKSLEGNLTPSEIRQLEVPVLDLTARYAELSGAVGSRCQELEAALLQCQGLQDAAETQAQWLQQAETLFKTQSKPASLIRERLDEQVREQRIAHASLEGRRATLAKLLGQVRDAAANPSNARIAKKLEQRAEDIYNRYEKLLERSTKRNEFLESVWSELSHFTQLAGKLDAAHAQLLEQADSRELSRMSADELRSRLSDLAHFRDVQMPLLDECLQQGKQLITKKDVTDTHVIRDRMKLLENAWRDFNTSLEEKQKLSKQRADQLSQYETLRAQVLEWLQSFENRVGRLQPVALDQEVLKQQADELRPLAKEYRDYSITIDKVNEAGAVYEALTRGDRVDSPHRKRQLYSPTKRQTPVRTLDGRSPSPTKGHGLVSPGSTHSTSSGFSSRRSSSDQLHLEELSPVQQQLSEINNRYSLLGTKLADRQQELDAVREELRKHEDTIRNTHHFLDKVQRQLPKDCVPNTKEEADKTIKQARAVLEEMYEKQSVLDSAKTQVRELLKRKQGVAGADRLHDAMEDVVSRWKNLHDACKDNFQEKVKSLSADLSDLEKELDTMKPPGRDIKTVRQQLDDVTRFYKKLERADDVVADVERAAEGLVDSGYAGDAAKTRDQVEGLRKQLGKLDERARAREQDLDDTLSKLEAFYKAYDSVMDDVQEASEQVRSLKPVSSEVEQIRAQQKDFAELRRRTLEPLGQNVAHCNKIGQGLVRSALAAVSTQQLEKDLEKMNDKWNALKEKMNERERRLDVGLLQSGKFAEALAGLDKWLSDTEDMVRNQKPPSADYKVVKAQLQEQKFLKKMLLDRQNSMSSLFAMGNEVAAGCDSGERKAIEKQLKGLMQRFDALTDGAQQRMLDLEQAMKVARQFQEELQPLVEWLTTTERKVKALELVPTDEEKIQVKIREHKVLHDDVLSKQGAFQQLTETASALMALVGDDEAAALADRLQAATDRYQALVEHSLNIGELLDNSRKGLRHLVLTYQDLSAWMDGMEQYLAKRKILPMHMEKLLRQMDELAEKTEEIASKQEAVDSTVDSGLELMKHISGDEALQLKDKLDALQRRYNDLTSKGADLLRIASETLPLVQQFFNTHNSLTEWMSGAESCLQSVEPREEDILRLEGDLQEFRPLLDNINLIGPQLCQISPGEGATHIEGIVTRDNRRFDAIAEQVQRKAERLLLSKKRSLEVVGDMEELLEWLRTVFAQLRDAEPPSSQPALVRAQLKAQRPLNDDVAAQRVRVRDLLSQAKKVLRECQSSEETAVIRDRSEELKEMMEEVGQLSAERLAALEQALPLAEHFADTHHGLSMWLDDMEKQIQMLAMPALRPEQIAQQQDKNEMLQQSILGHKPLVDKLVKTGEALARLVGEEDANKVQDIVEADCERYNALRAELRTRQQALEQALQESSQFSDKLEGMLRALAGTQDQLQRAEPVSAHPPKIQDQIEENNALIEDLEKRTEAYNAVQRAASDVISKANKSDPAVRDIRNKLDKLHKLWDDVQKATSDRGHSLDSALEVARKFWAQLDALMATLAELEDTLTAQPPPAAQPRAIQAQQVALQEIRHEIDHTKPEVEKVRKTGSHLMSLCGEPDKPEVKKHMEDLDSAWDNVTALYARREENLIDAMEKAMEFHDTLQNLQEFLDKAEDKFSRMGALGSDIDAVKRQISQLASFKQEVDPHMVKVEALNRQAQELTERTSSEQAAAIKQPLTEVNTRWSALLRGMVERQQQLERALLRLGQLQHALQELLAWINHTSDTLDTLKPVAGDPQILEVELAKLKVLVNDIAAHQASVDTLNDAGAQIVQQGTGTDEASETADKLNTLNRKWRELQQKARDRQAELEDALREAQSFNAEIGDLLSWLSEVDGVITASKPVGGLPETASEQLERFMEVYNEIEANRPKVEAVLQQGQEYLRRQEKPNPSSQLHQNLKNLKTRWDNITARASDKKIKLEIALKEATEFHDALQAFVDWLTGAEKTLSSAKPVSRVMETLLVQIEEHKSFQKEVATHRETMLHLDKKGTHLKYFSQKQDVILIKNLLVSVQHRWERVVAKCAERTRALDHGVKEAKEFSDMWNNLMNWLNDTEKQLDELNSETTVNDPEKIKQRLSKHREFQKALAAKQPVYDQTQKVGKTLKDKAPKTDEPTLRTMLQDLKTKWTTVCSKAVDRQRKLEEALLYSGQFKDAMSALLEWLKKQQSKLAADSPVHGDLDTVMALIEQHKQFEEDFHSREQQMQSVLKTGKDLEATVPREDASSIRQQCSELKQAWDSVQSLSEKKAHRLESALKEAEKLHKSVNMLLEWLSDAETKLRFSGQLPEGDQETQQQIRDHERFIRELKEKQRDKDDTISLAHSILGKAHPDAVTVIKHWITIIQSRWDEVWQWAMQRGGKLDAHMQSLKDLDSVLEELLQWLMGLENTLLSLEAEPLPESIELLEGLIEDHKELMENTQKRQNEVDRVCKAYQVKAQSQGRESTPRKVSAKSAVKGAPGRGSQHDLNRERSVSPDYYGSRRYSRVSPGRETPDRNLPHYGPRFPPRGSKGAEPEFRSPRVRQLWDKWRTVWLLAWERQRRLHERLAHLKELQRVSNFSWDDWRKRFLKFMNHKKSRLTDLFRKMDKDNNGLIPRNEFIDGIINTKFDTSRLEMGAVADLFDRNGSGLIDWEEFIAALRPDWVERRGPPTDADKIHDEVKRLVMLCTCRQKFRVFQVGEGKYRFGDSQKLRLVRILRSTVMVRVGGGWVALDEFLVKNDPCRAEEFLEQLKPIFEALRQREELPCSYPLHVGSTHGTKQAFIYGHSRSQGSTTPGAHHYTHHHGYQPSPGYHWVRERTARSVPMSGGVQGRASRSSLSAGTPDSLSDNEAASGLGARYKKPSVPRSTLTPGGSRPGSRPGSRTGSKPPSRHGSNLSLDSTDDVLTPSRIPMRKVTNTRASTARAAANAAKLGVATPNGGSRPRTPTGLLTPASGRYPSGAMYRTSSIPTLSPVPALVSSTHSQPSSMVSELPKSASHTHPAFHTQGSTKIPVYVGTRSQRSPSVERRLKISRKSQSREMSQEPSPTSQDPSRKSEQRSPEDDSSLFSISGMTSDNEYESNISESSGDASKPTQRDIKGSGSFASTDGHTPGRSRIPVLKDHHTNSNSNRQRTPSGSTTPVRPGQQTAVSRLLRKPSDASDSGAPATPGSRRGTPASSRTIEKREPFRL
ncbi:microtubule-actin cross-linking factor 1-like [Leguminivora glycinivorella]|uniref:microtubule-actin cross-linking factor 1-like n=1 Tax=Leguminivora glycinivorella TaxID=1035111 RepID=UPI00200F2565|nr:microtubule-actin cross-linking factor 1-like [Leguminivora glycinivorella]